MRRIFQSLIAIFLLCITLSARADVPRVLVSIKPIHSIVAGIMQSIGQPQLLVEGDSTPYGYKLSDSQQNALQSADIIIWTGPELEPFLVEPLAKLDKQHTVLELLDNGRLKVLPQRGQEGKRDPFLWLDTRNALILVKELTSAIVSFDPNNAERYQRNSDKLLEEIGALDREFEYGYRSVKAGKAFAYHDTLQYFEQAYGTRVVGTLSPAPGEIPGVEAFLSARARIYDEKAGIDCILTEAGMSDDNLSLLITGSRLKVAELDSFGTRLEPGPGLYIALMRHNFDAIKSCFEAGDDAVKIGAALAAAVPGNKKEVLPSAIHGRYILQDSLGRTVRDSDFEDTFQLITFGYTSCPDVCPITLQVISDALKRLGEQAEQVQPLFITVDPKRDTVEVLNKYVAYFHPRLIGLTGPQEMIDRVVAQFKVRVEVEKPEDSNPDVYTVNHTAGTYLLAPGGQFLKKFAYKTTSVDMAAGIKNYLDQR